MATNPYRPDFRIWIGDIEISGYVQHAEIVVNDPFGTPDDTPSGFAEVSINMRVPRNLMTAYSLSCEPVSPFPQDKPLPAPPKQLPEATDAS